MQTEVLINHKDRISGKPTTNLLGAELMLLVGYHGNLMYKFTLPKAVL